MTKFLNWAGREIDAIEAKLEQLAGRAVTHLDGEAAVLYEHHATKWDDDDVLLDEADVAVQEELVSEPDKAPEVEPDGDKSEDKSDAEPAAEEVEEVEEPKAKPKKSKKDDA